MPLGAAKSTPAVGAICDLPPSRWVRTPLLGVSRSGRTVRLKPGKEGDLPRLVEQLQATEQPGSGLVRSSAMQVARATMAEIFEGAPEFTDLTIVADWTP